MGVVVGVVGVHWLLFQTFSHVAGIQLKVLEADHFRGDGLNSLNDCFQEWGMKRERSPLTGEGDTRAEGGMDRRTDSA